MRRIAVFTGTRAEYGLLYWLMKDIQAHPTLELQVIAAAMHLSPEFGHTWQAIVDDGFPVDAKVEMLLSSDSRVGIAKSMGLGTIGLADALDRLAPDTLVILGDRFEALSAAQTALVMNIPIVHLHGGELTEGAYDDAIRHAITKMASLHGVAAEPYRQRVIQMGERPERVLNIGALGLDHLTRSPRMSRQALAKSLDFSLHAPYLLVTYHPVTLAEEAPVESFQALLAALDRWPDHQVILTYPNADNGGRAIIPFLEAYAAQQPERTLAIPSLGFQRYFSAVAEAAAVVGNSSSGLIEVPSFGVPTVNIGQRQSGRLAANSVLHCTADVEAIHAALQQALSADFQTACRHIHNPYGQGQAAEKIVEALATQPLKTFKHFYDLPGRPE
ncbi:UDP-N-acetylglucosamine 2-epimerase (non-hydrolysing) [Modicisalibacter ilicicola DSM 19980]|uniref:UDP-N-acetylglucosamine 2-epimerase (Non-hydrolysing) n=1 Tax=Modicisalibacter ilicicola DSM 19980 TaxID=1121942 RepID=A0A1M5EP26_9GAMM|nr:UDP-N-acetylglucosamine 2-epimerase [Halomonas ilicicola]SHF80947.1 UDP-N-acetylglucosamine 2-epimerase (non-hydrolysing) [Halomonas ilicicola DSM 19980]